MRNWQYLATWLAAVLPASAQCFLNSDWGNIAANQPFVLAWKNDGGFWDVLLNSDVRTQASLVGPIARNVTQPGVVWLPPADITNGDPNKLFAVQLWDLARGTTCSSPSFTFKTNNEPAGKLPTVPVISTSVSMSSGAILATATIAPVFTTGVEASYSSTIPTTTATTDSDATNSQPKSNTIAVIIGVVFGILIAILIALSILLWRARRRRHMDKQSALQQQQQQQSAAKAAAIERDAATPTPSTPNQHPSELDSSSLLAEMHVEEMRHEMDDSTVTAAEMPTQNVPPVELPAEVPLGLLAPRRRQSLVSEMTPTDSRRSSPLLGPVSPMT
ncbi:hypothetical protein MCOR25_008062 [Pyricularia grisea]|nr:hypothetical protein MCOR25_008062 [Pyricularia grisea]